MDEINRFKRLTIELPVFATVLKVTAGAVQVGFKGETRQYTTTLNLSVGDKVIIENGQLRKATSQTLTVFDV